MIYESLTNQSLTAAVTSAAAAETSVAAEETAAATGLMAAATGLAAAAGEPGVPSEFVVVRLLRSAVGEMSQR